MANASVDGKAVWYPLSAHEDYSGPLDPSPPDQSPFGVVTRTDGGKYIPVALKQFADRRSKLH